VEGLVYQTRMVGGESVGFAGAGDGGTGVAGGVHSWPIKCSVEEKKAITSERTLGNRRRRHRKGKKKRCSGRAGLSDKSFGRGRESPVGGG
jgi:hypothetical protein